MKNLKRTMYIRLNTKVGDEVMWKQDGETGRGTVLKKYTAKCTVLDSDGNRVTVKWFNIK